ncbi:Uncharacterized protein HSEST_3137 (plasmid) [Halapricum desulfuricans]|uniref:Uncharacterized protein n=1 Tax=Halapricum desulfuricans TaxID=2841257 RepID=A0A897NW01_9EURY|nr:Uncharacterized protein HSEST_3137 [Halapricum desulfuricans]
MADDQYRGLLTDREREILQGDADVSDSYRYRVISRIRTKIENIDKDVEILSNYREDLLEELREVVCEDSPPEPVDSSESDDRNVKN